MGPGEIASPARLTNEGSGKARAKQKLWLIAVVFVVAGALALSTTEPGTAKDRQPTTRIVSGTVYDEEQNIVFGATVELKDMQTGKVLAIYSQESGEYQYSGLRFDHDYTIKASYKGATSDVRRISLLDTRWHLVMNLTIPKPANPTPAK